MKIQYALMSCNSEMDYLGYWPLAAAAWRKLGITPVLFFIRDSDTVKPPPADGIVHEMEPLPDVEMAVQFTWARLWGAQRYPDDVVIVSDIDTLPLSRDYFVNQLRDIPDDRYVHLGSLFYIPQDKRASLLEKEKPATTDINRFSVPFHVARGSLIKEVLALPDDWGQAAREAAPWYDKGIEKHMRLYANVWNGDELYPTGKIHDYQDQSVFMPLLQEKTHPPVAEEGYWGRIIRGRCIDMPFQCVCDTALLKQDYYLLIMCPQPCTPQALTLMNFLLEDSRPAPSPDDKIQRLLAMEKEYLKHRGKLIPGILFGLQLLRLAYFSGNRSPMDAACSRLIKRVLKKHLWAPVRSLLAKSVPKNLLHRMARLRRSLVKKTPKKLLTRLRRLRNSLVPRGIP